MSEETNKEFDEMLEDVMGGESEGSLHSPEFLSSEKSLEAKEAPGAAEVFDPYGDSEAEAVNDSAVETAEHEGSEVTPEKTDSVKKECDSEGDAEKVALREQLTNYEKRLHDTQRAMHEAKEASSRLQKELEELKSNRSEGKEENWFSEDESSPVTNDVSKLEKEIEELRKQQREYQQEQAYLSWKKEADEFASKHSDFTSLVYEKLEPMLDEETGDPALLAAYMRWEDKSPAGAYAFAQKFFGIEEKLAAVSESSVKDEKEAKPSIDPTKGKAGLDRINSADFAEDKKFSGNLIEEVFG